MKIKSQSKLYFAFLLLFIYGCRFSSPQANSKITVIQNINIVDVLDQNIEPGQTVVVKDSMIHFIGSKWNQKFNDNWTLINGAGKYLIPGLWDMHFHISWEESNDSLLFQLLLSHGITGIRDMGGDLKILSKMKSKVKKDPNIGPMIFGAGPIIDGNPPLITDFTLAIDKNSDIPHLLDSLLKRGADFLKTYSLIREHELKKIAQFSVSRKIRFAGHLSEYVDPEISIQLGQQSIEHLNRLEDMWNHDTLRLLHISKLMKENNTWMCPTLLIYHLKASMNQTAINCPNLNQFIHPFLKDEWDRSREIRISKNDTKAWIHQKELFDRQLLLVKFMNINGVKLLAGSDFGGMPFVYPGEGLHEELAMLRDAGLSNYEVLQTATLNPVIFLGIQDKYGSIEMGKIADLIILNKNPIDHLSNLKEIHSVFRNGQIVHIISPPLCQN